MLQEMGDLVKAKQILNKCLDIDRSNPVGTGDIMVLRIGLKCYDDAFQLYISCLNQFQENQKLTLEVRDKEYYIHMIFGFVYTHFCVF